MTRGRPPKPLEIKRATGNPGKRKLPEPISIVPAQDGPLDAPDGLGAAGERLWADIWRDGARWLAPSDAILVELACKSADMLARLLGALPGEMVTESKTGVLRMHPIHAEIRAWQRELTAQLSLLGFSPTDRTRLGLAEVKRMSGLAELLGRRQADIGR
jgi:phage terminase small subunit